MGYAGVHGKTQSGLLCIKASDDRKAAGYSSLHGFCCIYLGFSKAYTVSGYACPREEYNNRSTARCTVIKNCSEVKTCHGLVSGPSKPYTMRACCPYHLFWCSSRRAVSLCWCSRLSEDMYSQEDVEGILDGLRGCVVTNLRQEVSLIP